MKNDEYFMNIAINEAKKGMGYTLPNPMVGAVIVKNHEMIGVGYHAKWKEAHAEVNAIKNAEDNGFEVEGATLYCTLEPCSHIKKNTPPCTELIVRKKIKKVVIASIDPNPMVSGRGVEFLKSHGVEVVVGFLKERADNLNKIFFSHIINKFPYIVVKTAQSLDGFIALENGNSKYITSIESRVDVHHDRMIFQNILIGGATLRLDNPKLDCRNYHQDYVPNRFVLTSIEKLPHLNFEIFNDKFKEKTFVITKKKSCDSYNLNLEKLKKLNVNVLEFEHSDFNLRNIFQKLYEQNFVSFYVEAGQALYQSLLKENLIDEIIVYQSSKILGNGKRFFTNNNISDVNEALEMRLVEVRKINNDLKIIYKVRN